MAGRFDRRRPGWSQDTARPLADNVGTTSNPQSPVFVPEAHSKAGSGLGGGDHPEAAPEAVSGPVRAVPGHGGWAGRVDMRFEPDHSGWRIVGPRNFLLCWRRRVGSNGTRGGASGCRRCSGFRPAGGNSVCGNMWNAV